MDNFFAIGLTVLLLLRVLPYVITRFFPRAGRILNRHLLRFRALLDIAGGTLMISLVVLLLLHRAWILALLLGLASIPTVLGLVAGFRVLARLQR